MNLRIFETTADLLSAAARTIVERQPLTIAISGGSTPKPLYEQLGRERPLDHLAVTWVVVDERCVPPGDPQHNATMIERTLFANGIAPSHRFLRFRTELEDPARTAEAFEAEWRAMNLSALDVILLGCGDDGHTASLFPGTTALDAEGIAAPVYVPRLGQWRVTLTLPVIRAATLRLVLAAGESKAPILREVRAGVDHPVALVTRELDSWWLVDRAAASQLL